jgi:Spy/CpxP family protein refolding chaperone
MDKIWKVVAAFVGVFVAGTVFGGFFALGVGQRYLEGRRSPAQFTDPGLLKRYVDLLQLTEEQKTKIKPILDKIQSEVNEIRRQANFDTAAVLKPIVEKAESDLKKILTAEQNAKLAEIEKNRGDLGLDFQGRGRGGPGGIVGGRGGFNPGGDRGADRGSRGGPGGPGSNFSGRGSFNPGSRGGFPGQDPKSSAPKTPEPATEPAAPAPEGK